MADDTQVNKGGRPVDTPLKLLERELKFTIKTVRTVREMIDTQVPAIKKQLSGDVSVMGRLDALAQLTTIMTALTRNIETLGKYSIGQANRRVAPAEDEPAPAGAAKTSSVLKDLLSK